MTKEKRTYNDLQSLHRKLKIEEQELLNKLEVFWKEKQFLFHILVLWYNIAAIEVRHLQIKTACELMCSGRVTSSCSTSDTSSVTAKYAWTAFDTEIVLDTSIRKYVNKFN